jgi:hypothetical protein
MAKANVELLQAAKRLVIDHANANGIALATLFESKEKFEDAIIGLVVATLIEIGLPVEDAYNTVFGAGEYEKLRDGIYQQFELNQA